MAAHVPDGMHRGVFMGSSRTMRNRPYPVLKCSSAVSSRPHTQGRELRSATQRASQMIGIGLAYGLVQVFNRNYFPHCPSFVGPGVCRVLFRACPSVVLLFGALDSRVIFFFVLHHADSNPLESSVRNAYVPSDFKTKGAIL